MLSELTQKKTLLNWRCLAFKGPMNDYPQPDSALSLGTEALASSNGTESHCSFRTIRSCLLQHLRAPGSAAQLEISRYQLPGGICSSVNLIWKHFIFSLSFIISLVHVTVTHALFLLTQTGACRDNVIPCLMHGLSVWGLVVSVTPGSSKGSSQPSTFMLWEFVEVSFCGLFFFFPHKKYGLSKMQTC